MTESPNKGVPAPQVQFNLPPEETAPPQISSPDPIRAKEDSLPPSPMKLDFDKESCNSTENSSFVLDVNPTDLESLWVELGLLPSEIDKEKNRLNRLIGDVRHDAKKAASDERLKYYNDIEKIKDRHCALLLAIGGTEEDCDLVKDSGYEGTLRQRLDEVRANFEMFEPKCAETIKEFEELKKKTDALFDQIGYSIEDRGDFAEIGETDLSEKRKQSFRDKAKELEEEVEDRVKEFAKMKEKAESIAQKIGSVISARIKELFDSNNISTESFETVQEYLEDLSVIRNSRIAQISELALEITHEWELLEIPEAERKEFIDNHSQLTEKCIQDFSDEVVRLRNLRNEKLPELIERVKTEITTICQSLHYTQQEIDIVLARVKVVPKDTMATFSAYESMVIDLRRLLITSQPIIDLIKQRDEIVKEYEEMAKEESFNNNRDDTKPIDPKTDKIRRRYKFVLPRLEKKLLLAVLEFKQTNGTDFMWDGTKVSDEYEYIKLSPAELSQLRTDARRKSVASRKSLGTSVATRSNKNINFLFE